MSTHPSRTLAFLVQRRAMAQATYDAATGGAFVPRSIGRATALDRAPKPLTRALQRKALDQLRGATTALLTAEVAAFKAARHGPSKRGRPRGPGDADTARFDL